MPHGTKPLSLIRGRRVRITRLDGYGRRVYGEYGQAISSGIVTAGFTANTVDTDEIRVTTFDGEDCVFEPAVTSLSGYSLTLVFCAVDFDMFELLTGMPIVFDADGNVVGIEVDTKISLENVAFGFELWAGAGAEEGAAPDAAVNFGLLILPFVKGGYLGDFTVENNAVNFTIAGATTREGNSWGSGPYAVQDDGTGNPGPLITPMSSTAALRLMMTTVAPPQAVVGSRPLLDPALAALTSIAGIEGATAMEADFTTTPAATGPVWWDFGDDEWDYVAAPGAASHLYGTAGTYTARASQNGIDWVSTTVTVPFVP